MTLILNVSGQTMSQRMNAREVEDAPEPLIEPLSLLSILATPKDLELNSWESFFNQSKMRLFFIDKDHEFHKLLCLKFEYHLHLPSDVG